jgi:hypothetical protein
MNGTILLVSDTPICGPFGPEAGPEKALSSSREDAIRARLADTAAQGARRRRLEEILKRPTPAWNPDDHPEIDAAGGAAEWVMKMRAEAELGFRRRTGVDETDDYTS